MSLTKLLRKPINMFTKDVISFLIIRRHDLGIVDSKLRYLATKPSSSIHKLRRKVWHLLELPDFCEEIIILKNDKEVEIPLTELCKGNNPHHPFILEVYLPAKRHREAPGLHNMLTMGEEEDRLSDSVSTSFDTGADDKINSDCGKHKLKELTAKMTMSHDGMTRNNLRVLYNQRKIESLVEADFKKSEISTKLSSSSIFKLNRRKSRDNFANILMKIQSDLNTLTNKISTLEARIIN